MRFLFVRFSHDRKARTVSVRHFLGAVRRQGIHQLKTPSPRETESAKSDASKTNHQYIHVHQVLEMTMQGHSVLVIPQKY